MLIRVGWKDDFVNKSVPVLPISGWLGDNLIAPSANMPWYKGQEVISLTGEKVMVHTLLDGLDKFVIVPERKTDAPLRLPISGEQQLRDTAGGCA